MVAHALARLHIVISRDCQDQFKLVFAY